jgi:peptidyl-prolyl cis-trans isomerase C
MSRTPRSCSKESGPHGLAAAALVALLIPFGGPFAASPVLVTAPGGISVTTDEVRAEAAQRLPADVRGQAMADPRNVVTLANDIAIRRVLVAQAVEAGLDKDPEVVLRLQVAREKALSEARLAQLDSQKPDRAALEKVALAEYRAQPERFTTPEQVRVRHILIDARSCEAEKRIAQLLEQARAPGADFAALAQEFSQDPGSAKRGGDLGLFERGRMAPEFDKAAFSLTQPGEISGVVRTQFGFHIIRLEERRPASREPFEKVRDPLIREIDQRETRSRRARVTEPISAGLQVNAEAVEAFAKQAR